MKEQLKVVKGELPQKRDVVDWGEQKLLQFVRFVDAWILDGSFKVTNDTIATMEMRAPEEPFWLEFMVRINVPTERSDFSSRKFLNRLLALSRSPLSWLKANPYAVTPAMKEIMEKSDRMRWALEPMVMKDTEIGGETMEMNHGDTLDPGRSNANVNQTKVKSPLEMYHSALYNILSVALVLTKDIKPEDLKNMPVKDRLKLANDLLSGVTKGMTSNKPNSVIFQQINVNKSGREELEKSLLEYQTAQE